MGRPQRPARDLLWSLMPIPPEPPLPKSGFTENLLRINNLSENFSAWVFYPGMFFLSTDIWWRDSGRRSRPHEGLDLCCYQDRQGQIRNLHKGIAVPVLYEGEIVKTEEDFLGKSVYVRHTVTPAENFQLYSAYGHISPSSEAVCGKYLKTGDILGSIADAALKNSRLPSHLHITIALAGAALSLKQLTWSELYHRDVFLLLDPLGVLDGKYVVRQSVPPAFFKSEED